ncbi:hypothetical protein [Salibacterium halotolerans]|uniref:Uncharacterized protein n=1 Tax=Salibacterium halotolerans TaxID=1884432 RepID=A0A1I5PP53_9BACI|nr:hypothetical protein [Salibacterium halotolerans]SFP35570.1 hypothetical protein SAMN05518683_104177 [Salibacterium halotolerans]
MEFIGNFIIVLGSMIIMTGLVRKLADIIGNQLDFYGVLQQAWYKVKKK